MRNLLTVTLLLAGLMALAACGGQTGAKPAGSVEQPAAVGVGDPAKGKTVFDVTCLACHGPDAKGIAGLGKDMTTSAFIKDKTDDEMVAFLKVGRATDDPLNTTGVAMPPLGGNPAMTEDQLKDVIAYVRTLQQ